MVKRYNFNDIRILLIEGFTDEELRDLCFDVVDFRPVYHQLARNSGKDEIVRRLVEHVDKALQVDELLRLAKEHNPAKYEQHQPYYTDLISSNKPPEPETILIPTDPFLMGNPEAIGEWQQHLVTLSVYKIGKYPVTNEQYAQFVASNPDRRPDPVAGWHYIKPRKGRLDHPVAGVSWADAVAYCTWLSQQTGQTYRLPTEAEWEKAARGDQDSRRYPWGDDLSSDYCNYNSTQTTPVNQYSKGQSPYGCFDMVGNVREMTSTLWGDDWRRASFTYPYKTDQREALNLTLTVYRIYRGGAFNDKVNQLGCSARGKCASNARDGNLGFRVVLVI